MIVLSFYVKNMWKKKRKERERERDKRRIEYRESSLKKFKLIIICEVVGLTIFQT